jgi:hypothetical protein
MSNEKTNNKQLAENVRRYRIVPIGSGLQLGDGLGWAIERDGVIWNTGPNLEALGAWLDAILAGASVYDAEDIAKVIAQRPRPSYEERLTVFKPTGRPAPSRDPFAAPVSGHDA